MKKIAVLSLMMMASFTLSAQWSVTPEVGITAFKRGGATPYVNWGSSYDDWRAGLKLGAAVEYDFTERFALKSGLYYANRGFSGSRFMLYTPGYSSSIEGEPDYMYSMSKVNRHFLQVPLQAKFSWNVGGDVRLNVAAGPYVALCLGEKSEYGFFTTDGTYKMYYPEYNYGQHYYNGGGGYNDPYAISYLGEGSNYNRFDWGTTVSVGAEFGNWITNVGYDISLGKEFSHDDVDPKYHTLSLTVGYKFKLGK